MIQAPVVSSIIATGGLLNVPPSVSHFVGFDFLFRLSSEHSCSGYEECNCDCCPRRPIRQSFDVWAFGRNEDSAIAGFWTGRIAVSEARILRRRDPGQHFEPIPNAERSGCSGASPPSEWLLRLDDRFFVFEPTYRIRTVQRDARQPHGPTGTGARSTGAWAYSADFHH
jgi:hypothetical protein